MSQEPDGSRPSTQPFTATAFLPPWHVVNPPGWLVHSQPVKAKDKTGSKVFPAALQPGMEVGRWRVVGVLGVGGYGMVYRVEHVEAPGRYFALKLSLHQDPARALREIALLMDKAQHPNVIRVHASGRWPDPVSGFPFFVMDSIEGPALHTWADTFNPSFRQLALAGGAVALALDLLHARGVVHRDLKPEHILISMPEVTPVLIDFGAGDDAGAATLTTAALPPGTHPLRSPEAVRFQHLHWRKADARYAYAEADDLYALGVCLYRAATGYYPFSPELPTDLLYMAIATLVPPPPHLINPRIPAPLSAAILKLLEKSPEVRTRTGGEAYADLVKGMLSGDPKAFEARLFEEEQVPAEAGAPPTPRVRRPQWPEHAFPQPTKLQSTLARLMPHELIGVLWWWYRLWDRRAVPPRLARKESRLVRAWKRWGLALPLMLLLGGWGTWAALARTGEADTTGQVTRETSASPSQKVASASEPPHTARAAVPPPAGPTPAAVVPSATLPEESASVTRNTPAATPAPQKQDLSPARRMLKAATLAACTGMACASNPPLMDRPTPPSEPCPEASLKAMKEELGLEWQQFGATFDPTYKLRTVSIREGRAALYTSESMRRVPSRTKLLGTVYVGEKRIYGRFTEARLPPENGSKIVPVCFELWSIVEGERGLGFARKPGGDATTAIISPQVSVRMVDVFE